jgi:non-ribosomal peptide synthetase component F
MQGIESDCRFVGSSKDLCDPMDFAGAREKDEQVSYGFVERFANETSDCGVEALIGASRAIPRLHVEQPPGAGNDRRAAEQGGDALAIEGGRHDEDPEIGPKQFPKSLTIPRTSLWYNLEVAAARYPEKPATIFYDSRLSYAELRRQAERLAGFLQLRCGIRKGDRVLLDLQNSPQFIVAYYAILRAEAVVVPTVR